MKSLSQWRNKNLLREFVGPAGQTDPNGFLPPTMPTVVPTAPAGAARPGMAPSAMMKPPAAPENDETQSMMQNLVDVLSTKSEMQVAAIRDQFNMQIDQLLGGRMQGPGIGGGMAPMM